MESPGQSFDRLLKALDQLVREEAAAVERADYAATQEIQQRVDPLISALAKLAPQIRSAAMRARLTTLVKRRRSSIEMLESRMAAVRAELTSLRQSTHRVARIAPAYGRAGNGPTPNRLRASG